MCGLVAIIGPGADYETTRLNAMSDAIAHRGPNGSGAYSAPDCMLGHRRLSIIDLSEAGAQPMTSSCQRYTLVFNGMIYNYLELRQALQAKGDVFVGGSDTEVLLVGLARYGDDFVHQLNGMFAFAFWDKAQRRLFAARDRFGEKPLVYTNSQGRLYMASEAKALLRLPDVSGEPDPQAVADFAADRITNQTDRTFFKAIKQIPAGSTLTWQAGEVRVQRYWQLPLTPEDAYVPPRDGEIAALLQDAISLRLRADTPVGCLLSGGLDSTYIASAVQRLKTRSDQSHTYSTVHNPPYEEASGIDAFSAAYPEARLHFDQPTQNDFWDALPDVLFVHEQPFGDASMVAHYRLMRLVRETGTPVVLGGQAADEVFAGYPAHLWMYLGFQLGSADPQSLAALSQAMRLYSAIGWKPILGHATPIAVTRPIRERATRNGLAWLHPAWRQTESAFHHAYSGADLARTKNVHRLDQALAKAIETRTLPGFLHYQDRNAMAFGVEGRLPFLDHRLVERLFQIAPKDKLAGMQTKALLRDAAAGLVPESVRTRLAKQGYPAPLAQWLRANAEPLRRVLACPDTDEIVNVRTWRGAVSRFLAGDNATLDVVWRGFLLTKWRERFRNFSRAQAA